MTGQRLSLLPIGVGNACPAPGAAQSGYLVRGGAAAVMVDMGSGVLTRLREVVAPETLTQVVVTHLHPDHCVDLMGLEVHMVWGPGAGSPPLPVLGPPGLRERLIAFSGASGFDRAFTWATFAPEAGELALGDGLVMRHREVPHLPPTNAVRFERGGASICFGSDCAFGDALPELARGCDVLVCEATFGTGPPVAGVPHMTAAEAGRTAARAAAGRLLLTHLDPTMDAEATLAAARAEFGGPVGLALPGEAVTA
ncbi:MAG TPA: MBL fold metallo-hydrolase [Miltoncostaea sp.]|nr:MBL fold metallo-hydrolase [Miltoncostaea sp.]